jgi:hypothetical protein
MTKVPSQDPKSEKRVFMRCKNPKCESIEVVEIAYAPGTRLYRCVKCNMHHPVQVGGKMDMRHL